MSASLVGSEMCIRDSACYLQRLALIAPIAPIGLRRGAPLSPPVRSRPSACLLYTSDAADDM
eukprot:1124041-Alexandrium_andersonii.AAC.1